MPVSPLNLKLSVLDIFYLSYFSLAEDKIVPVPCRTNGMDNDFEYDFVKISRYLNLEESLNHSYWKSEESLNHNYWKSEVIAFVVELKYDLSLPITRY